MNKTVKIDDIEVAYSRLSKEWNDLVRDIHLSNKSMYNIISLKKKIEEQHLTIQETVGSILRSHGAEETENGGLKVPQEKIAETNKDLNDLAAQDVDIEYQPIIVKEEDSLPSTLMEILYDFIIVE